MGPNLSEFLRATSVSARPLVAKDKFERVSHEKGMSFMTHKFISSCYKANCLLLFSNRFSQVE